MPAPPTLSVTPHYRPIASGSGRSRSKSLCPWLSVTHQYPRGLRWPGVTFARPSEPQTTAELPIFPEVYAIEKVAENGCLLRPPTCLSGHRQVQSHGERGRAPAGQQHASAQVRLGELSVVKSLPLTEPLPKNVLHSPAPWGWRRHPLTRGFHGFFIFNLNFIT